MPPPLPPPPPHEPAGGQFDLRSPQCSRYLHTPSAKFHKLWGRQAWVNRGMSGNLEPCWGSHSPSRYFGQLSTRPSCDTNWHEGTRPRPQYTAAAPALLGFDASIWDYCTEVHDPGGMQSDDWNVELVRRCVLSNQNILRMMTGYDMCVNMHWVVCAAKGYLPGQAGRPELRFAHAPRDLDTRDLDDPTRRGGWWTEPHETHFAVSDVYFAEVIILSAICANSWRLFSVRRGEIFQCEWSESGYRDLVSALTAGTGRESASMFA